MADGRTLQRWFGVGHSTAIDAAVAGAEAATSALEGREAAVLLVFTSRGRDLNDLCQAVRKAAGPDIPIVGGTAFGEIAPCGALEHGVVVIALGGNGITVRTALSREISGRQRAAGMEVAQAVGSTGCPHEVLVLIPDGAVGRLHDVVRGAYAVVGATMPMAGGCTGDQGYLRTHQFYGEHDAVEVLADGLAAVLIGSEAPIGVGVAHGWRPYGEPMGLTSSDETRIHEFDHQPALDVYLRRIGRDDSDLTDSQTIADLTLQHPLGLSRRSGQDIRIIHSIDQHDRSMMFFADVQQGGLAWLMETDRQSLIDSGSQSCLQAIRNLDGRTPIGVIAFNCGVRRMMLQDAVSEEVARMVESACGAPVAGCYSMGEIARVRGARGMHHLTAVALAFG